MKVLGLSVGEQSTVALMVDGEIVAAVSEERFSRLKNDERFPLTAIDYCLKKAGISGAELDRVAFAGSSLAFGPWVVRAYSTFSIADHIKAQREYWKPRLYENKDVSWIDVFKEKIDTDQFPYNFEELLSEKNVYYSEEIWPKLKESIETELCKFLGIEKEKIVYVDHHTCHAAYAYWGSPFRDEKTLVLTADAYGDGNSATISIAEGGEIKRIHKVADSEFKLARLYRYITLLLGMKPNEHEYKVMGMAPYAKDPVLKGPYEVFKETMYVDGLNFAWKEEPKDMYYYFKDKLEGYRFDGIAGGLQKYTEEIITEWVRNAVEHTGIKRIVFSGGIAMNVKTNMLMHGMDEVDDMFVCGSGSDESLSLGVCYHVMEKHCAEKDLSAETIKPHSMYLGPEFSNEEVEKWVAANGLDKEYEVEYNVDADTVAEYLANGQVIGRLAGRMEFGQRSLGNRSLIADPRGGSVMVDKINHKIKNRDFWMPFAPSILNEYADEYIENPKKIKAPHMSVGFESTKKGQDELSATMHPSDKTLRPQLVEESKNAKYHELLSAFRSKTGVGGVLNTSFNLHGSPIVCSPDDALYVFRNSEIDMILLEDTLIKKK
ncbi:carbamoyltransferase C-terminal domain-containing protein [Desulfovibrio sp. JC022]|uniref:carbamoyltransferase C-terminal domain-containing protein n=1 Tax=Desulfovibrio sp. JC022 TaxID=2593642 RepID=UPI0013D28B06|nr:carbamoyltransferase C-terminal domain-containing protein [Desulfovibrio sp. JC022]NDV23480.1 carbamoyl transferase [Desulfovibrio sp. JC022]